MYGPMNYPGMAIVAERQRQARQQAELQRLLAEGQGSPRVGGFVNPQAGGQINMGPPVGYQGPTIGADREAEAMAARGMTPVQIQRAQASIAQHGRNPSFGNVLMRNAIANDQLAGIPGMTMGIGTGAEIAGTFAAGPALAGTRLANMAGSVGSMLGRIPGAAGAHRAFNFANPTLTRFASTEGGKIAAEVGNKAVSPLLYSDTQSGLGRAIKPLRDSKLIPSYARLGALLVE